MGWAQGNEGIEDISEELVSPMSVSRSGDFRRGAVCDDPGRLGVEGGFDVWTVVSRGDG